jgi:mono/diheme cytochrome c family protein
MHRPPPEMSSPPSPRPPLPVPADLRNKKNPLPSSQEVIAAGRAHFADHCAYCHANDGKGQTAIGQAMYPKLPDMTLRDTQSQSDGELFATIENGIRLTGMPAWGDGTADSAAGTWALVHFIRHLPQITPEELEEMKGLNPKTREEPHGLREDLFEPRRLVPCAEPVPHHADQAYRAGGRREDHDH